MVEFYSWKTVEVLGRISGRECGTRFSQTFVVHAFEASHVLLRHAVPNHVSRIQVSPLAHGGPPCSVSQPSARRPFPSSSSSLAFAASASGSSNGTSDPLSSASNSIAFGAGVGRNPLP